MVIFPVPHLDAGVVSSIEGMVIMVAVTGVRVGVVQPLYVASA